VAVILSAQCTDKRVNLTTPEFFKQFPTPKLLAKADLGTVYLLIKSISYPNNKAKNLIGMANVLVNEFKSNVPDDVDLLQKMPGVGRKTANVIASVIFNKPALAVDTHVFRVSARLGFTPNAKTPLETERELMKLVPLEKVPDFHHWIILHGRYVCTARSPKCDECGIHDYCQSFGKF
jgi:endonuclease-3